MAYKIEKNIKPPMIKKTGAPNKYPFNEMNIGESFISGEYSQKNWNKLANAARNWAKYQDDEYVFQLAREGDNIRIWRIK